MTGVTQVRPRQLTAELLGAVAGTHTGVVSATERGVVAGLNLIEDAIGSSEIGRCELLVDEGQSVSAGTAILEISGTAIELATAENIVMGPLGFAGGVAARCRRVIESAPAGLSIACGGWKKLPAALKPLLRAGLDAGGVTPRLVDGDFVYIDKNTMRLLGGIRPAVSAGVALGHGAVAVQVASPDEAIDAVRAGADIIMDDTGQIGVLRQIHTALDAAGVRDRVTLAFAGGVKADDLQMIRECGADVVDMGRAIIDAPLWDLHLEVQP